MKAETGVMSPSGICCHYSLHSKAQRRKHTKKRKRKSSDQLRQLKVEFEKHTEWTKELMTEIAQRIGLSEAQVYKWGWDQKKKITFKTSDSKPEPPTLLSLFSESAPLVTETRPVSSGPVFSLLLCGEVLSPSLLDIELYSLQKEYRLSVEEFARNRCNNEESKFRSRVVCR